MADKFPELESIGDSLPNEGGDSDFLRREKELVGNEFQTEHDHVIFQGLDDEINDFKQQFPEVGVQEPIAEPINDENEPDEEFEEFETTKFGGESKHLSEWKQRRDLEINQRESVNLKKKQEIIEKAQQTIDDFYDNYNKKREEQSKQIRNEEESFLAKRDEFLSKGTLWDRVNLLTAEVGETGGTRDKSRFKGLLAKLKGKENVPGAGGY